MSLFAYHRAEDVADAMSRIVRPGAMPIAGGTDLLQLVREHVLAPAELVDINAILDAGIAAGPAGVRIGAGTRLADLAAEPAIAESHRCVAEAVAETASPQVRHMATVGGNLLQRTRCLYFRDIVTPCNKRAPGSGCSAIGGQNRINAILGTSEHCIATHASDLAVALLACDATVVVLGDGGERRVPIGAFHCPPGSTPDVETVLAPGELITAVELPEAAARRRSRYLKVRDRASFEWAIAACAVSLRLEEGKVAEIRVAAGGVATVPWRMAAVEAALLGRVPDEDAIAAAAARAVDGAVTHGHNAYKVALLQGTVRKALREVL
jgi:xanthine dehydrogenase YagS FAD-binding subunit